MSQSTPPLSVNSPLLSMTGVVSLGQEPLPQGHFWEWCGYHSRFVYHRCQDNHWGRSQKITTLFPGVFRGLSGCRIELCAQAISEMRMARQRSLLGLYLSHTAGSEVSPCGSCYSDTLQFCMGCVGRQGGTMQHATYTSSPYVAGTGN